MIRGLEQFAHTGKHMLLVTAPQGAGHSGTHVRLICFADRRLMQYGYFTANDDKNLNGSYCMHCYHRHPWSMSHNEFLRAQAYSSAGLHAASAAAGGSIQKYFPTAKGAGPVSESAVAMATTLSSAAAESDVDDVAMDCDDAESGGDSARQLPPAQVL